MPQDIKAEIAAPILRASAPAANIKTLKTDFVTTVLKEMKEVSKALAELQPEPVEFVNEAPEKTALLEQPKLVPIVARGSEVSVPAAINKTTLWTLQPFSRLSGAIPDGKDRHHNLQRISGPEHAARRRDRQLRQIPHRPERSHEGGLRDGRRFV